MADTPNSKPLYLFMILSVWTWLHDLGAQQPTSEGQVAEGTFFVHREQEEQQLHVDAASDLSCTADGRPDSHSMVALRQDREDLALISVRGRAKRDMVAVGVQCCHSWGTEYSSIPEGQLAPPAQLPTGPRDAALCPAFLSVS